MAENQRKQYQAFSESCEIRLHSSEEKDTPNNHEEKQFFLGWLLRFDDKHVFHYACIIRYHHWLFTG